MPPLSVVIPCFNEEHRVAAGMVGLRLLEVALGHPVELILVDDGSTDGTIEAMRREAPVGAVILTEPHRGKGGALRAGVLRATGDRILLADVDWSCDPVEIPRLLASDGDLVLGVREGPDAHRLNEPFYRHLMGRVFNNVVQSFLLAGHSDTQCGFKVIRRAAARDVFSRLTVDGWAYDVELVYLTHFRGWRVREVPVVWRFQSDSRIHLVRDGWGMLSEIRLIRRNIRRGVYGDLASPACVAPDRSSAGGAGSGTTAGSGTPPTGGTST